MTALSLRSTADDVAEMERNMQMLQTENDSLKSSLALATADNTRLANELSVASDKAEKNLVRAIQMESIMRQVSAGLLDGIKRMQDANPVDVLQAHTEQALRDAAQRQGQTGANGNDSPPGVQQPEPPAAPQVAAPAPAPAAPQAEPPAPQPGT